MSRTLEPLRRSSNALARLARSSFSSMHIDVSSNGPRVKSLARGCQHSLAQMSTP